MRPILEHPLQYWNERPEGISVDTIVIHSIYSLTAADPCHVQACITALEEHQVASHYLIAREGETYRFVEENRRAWHAGESRMPFADDQRSVVNDFSIGIELVGHEDEIFAEEQYSSLAALIADIALRHPIRSIVGHEHIAPSRKTDPGKNFDWKKLRAALAGAGMDVRPLRFGDDTR